LSAQEIDLDKLINDSSFTAVDNLNASINSGLSNSLIQVIRNLNPFQVNFSLNKVWIQIDRNQQTGSLANTGNFAFPVAQVEVGMPYRIHLIGRGATFEIGKENKEKALVWGAGLRYGMFEDTTNIRAGVVIIYEEVTQIDDFDLASFIFQGYIGFFLSRLNIYIAPVASRSVFNIHLNDPEGTKLKQSKIDTYIKFSTGIHLRLTNQVTVTGNIILGDYSAVGFGGNITLF
jgi:hypothetical protein